MSKSSRAARRAAKNAPPATEPVDTAPGSFESPVIVATDPKEIASDSKEKKKIVRYAKRTWGPKDVITLNRKDNHKKGKSFHRYALYRDGMTVQDYVDAVTKAGLGNKTLASNDLRWDTAPTRNFITITPAQ